MAEDGSPKVYRPLRDAQWWRHRESGRAPHEVLDSVIRSIRTQQSARYEAYRRWSAAYGANISAFGQSPSFRSFFNQELKVNELANTVDTLVAQVFKNRIVPSPHTVGGDWQQRKRAESLGRWLDGVFDECGVFDEVIPAAGLASFLYGTGPIKVTSQIVDEEKKQARIVVEWAPTWLTYVDEIEGRFRKPPNFYQRHLVDRWKCLADFAAAGDDDESLWGTREEREKAILDATHTANDDDSFAYGNEGDQLVVTEAWHLPSAPWADDGAHVIAINSCTLYVEKFARKRFPFAFVRHGVPLGEFWGSSLVQRLEPLQVAQDRMDDRIDAAMAMMAVPRIILSKNSGIQLDHIDDIPFAVLTANDINGVREWNAQPVHPDLYQHRNSMADRMRGIAGVSAYAAQGMIPAGLRNASGRALEAYEDTENARHAMLHRSYEAAIIDLAEIIIDEAEELADRGYSVTSRAMDRNAIQVLDFKDVRMDRDDYVLRLPPISQLAKGFSSRLEQLDKLVENKAITINTYRRMLGNPDIEAENEIDTADDEIILKNFHVMIDEGEALSPMSTDNLGRIVELAGKFINWCRLRNVPSERWALVSQYADEAIRLKGMATPPPAPAPMPGPMPSAPPNPMGAPPMPPGPPMGAV